MSILDKLSLKGHTGIVTGGSGGLGQAFCKGFAEMGANIVVVGQDTEAGHKTVKNIEALGVQAIFVKADVTKRSELDMVVQKALPITGRIDFMMNNAGITLWEEAEKVSEENWRKLMAVNLDAVFYGCQAVFEVMKKQGKGSIINTASICAHIVTGPQCEASYNTSKAAVRHLTSSLAVEWAKYGIRVNSISPGYMTGPMSGPFFDDPQYGPKWMGMTPMGRPGEPEELCGAAILLASDASSFTTGSDVVIDGGYLAL